jgi:Carboxypeptidase regulatory-like domain/Putative zinc-finger
MSEILQAGQHPDADQLNAFAEHTLPAHEQQQTLAHLAICPDCRQIVALALPPAGESPVAQPADRSRWFPRWHPAWSGIPAFAALILVLLFVRNSERKVGQTSVPAQVADARKPTVPPVESAPPVVAQNTTRLAQRAPQKGPVVPRTQPASGSAGAMVGGVLGGIANVPSQPPTPGRWFGVSSAGIGAQGRAPVVGRVVSSPSPLPSRLAVLSMASRGNQRIAIDADSHLFFSEDEGKNWKTVPSPWKGRAVLVALTSHDSSGNAAPALKMSARSAAATGAALSGTITDPSGAVISNAVVVATQSAGEIVRNASTDQHGQFRMADLVPGSYLIEVRAVGFQTETFSAEVAPAQQAVADVRLRVGSASQTVAVEAEPVPLENLPAAANLAANSKQSQPLLRFELTTDAGERWMSTDGQKWVRE